MLRIITLIASVTALTSSSRRGVTCGSAAHRNRRRRVDVVEQWPLHQESIVKDSAKLGGEAPPEGTLLSSVATFPTSSDSASAC